MLTIRDLVPWHRRGHGGPALRGVEHPFLSLQREFDRLYDDFWRMDVPALGRVRGGEALISPQVDVTEDDKQFVVTAELPGLDEKDVEVTLGDDTLTISGEKKSEHEAEEGGYRTAERVYGSFRRTLPLSDEVLADKVEASFKNGVLTVVLPKNPEAPKRVRKVLVHGAEKAPEGESKAA